MKLAADKLLTRFIYVTRQNRHDTLADFCHRVDTHPGLTRKPWEVVTKRVTGGIVSLKDIDPGPLREVCTFLASAIRATPTQTDDASWFPDDWKAAVDHFPANPTPKKAP